MVGKKNGLERRSFTNFILGSSLCGLFLSVLYPVFRFLSPPDAPEAATNEIEAGSVHDPEFVDKGYKIVRFGSEPVLLVHLGQREFRAFSATCTHLDCIVEYQQKEQRIWCNCHNGEYDLSGRNIAGPPPKPLKAFNVNLVARGAGKEEVVVISRS